MSVDVLLDAYEPGSRSSLDSESADALILDFPAYRTVKNKCLLFISYPSMVFCYSSPNRLKQCIFRPRLKIYLILIVRKAMGLCAFSNNTLFDFLLRSRKDRDRKLKRRNCLAYSFLIQEVLSLKS